MKQPLTYGKAVSNRLVLMLGIPLLMIVLAVICIFLMPLLALFLSDEDVASFLTDKKK